ncbi:fimbrial protein [Paraherbaspirillum soli]|uniref:Fimbrial protein n=1 Tax=Paraherbaspirillum soli TaxID=631222 RepID=A0ABW0M2W0_9BURK
MDKINPGSVLRYIAAYAAVPMLTGLSPAHADEPGTLLFKGGLSTYACNVTGSDERVVNLPPVSSTELLAAGREAGLTPFTLEVECDPGVRKVRAYFENGATVDAATGNLKLLPGGASNVQIRLRNADNSVIFVGHRPAMQAVDVGRDGMATLKYQALYYATGKAGAGLVNTRVTYAIEMP